MDFIKKYALTSLAACLLFITSTAALAEKFDPAVEGFMRNQQRQEELQKQVQGERDVRFQELTAPQAAIQLSDFKEEPCFIIHTIRLEGDQADRFRFGLDKAQQELNFTAGMCLGVQGINLLMTQAQNTIISKGFTTTRILAQPQDLTTGTLVLAVVPGLVRDIKVDLTSLETTHADRMRSVAMAFPIKTGDVLNLYAIEQGLENLKRVPTVEADIQIVPADAPNQSDILVKWIQRDIPARINFNLDDSGSKQTGKNQGSVTFSLDNMLGISDLFYVSMNHDLGHKSHYRDANGRLVEGSTRGHAFHYSVPFGNWLLSINSNEYNYEQAVPGYNQVYNYSGESISQDLGLTRLLYRDSKRKTSATLKGWFRSSKSFIDDAELTIQRRRVAGWQLNLDHREYLQSAVLDLGLGYKRGTGMRNALKAPEEQVNEGTSRMQIITLDANLGMPFQLANQNFNYSSALHAQWNNTRLTSQDQLSIGGRYTVRGFDGDMSLMAERGFYWRNDVAWAFKPSHQLYLALDAGQVSGPSAKWLLGRRLVGSAVGFRGQFKLGGVLYYDIFAGTPLHKPKNFRSMKTTYGFSVGYSI